MSRGRNGRWSPSLKRSILGFGAVLLLGVLLLVGEVLHALYGFGPPQPFSNPSRSPLTVGRGPVLRLVVIGDSTGAGQGAPYSSGIAIGAARYLGHGHQVTLINLSISGARLADLLRLEVPWAVRLRPDIIIISAGANDVTHFTPSAGFRASARLILDRIHTTCPNAVTVVLGSPDLGATPRFAQPLRWFAGRQTRRINRAWLTAVQRSRVVWAPVVSVGPRFATDPSLSSIDRFHPNAHGYAVWMPVVQRGLDQALLLIHNAPVPSRAGS